MLCEARFLLQTEKEGTIDDSPVGSKTVALISASAVAQRGKAGVVSMRPVPCVENEFNVPIALSAFRDKPVPYIIYI